MPGDTKIDWCRKTWNLIRGCSRAGAGCDNCYAQRQAIRQAADGKPYAGLVRSTPGGPRWTGRVEFVPSLLPWPLTLRDPCSIFVASMADPFHPQIKASEQAQLWAIMALSGCVPADRIPGHTFLLLTKRPGIMRRRLSDPRFRGSVAKWVRRFAERHPNHFHTMGVWPTTLAERIEREGLLSLWPLPSVWLGVSPWDQRSAEQMIPLLLMTPAAHRFVSYEPAIGPVDLRYLQPSDPPTEINALAGTHGVLRPHRGRGPALDQVIVGGETGPHARPFHIDWARGIERQCDQEGVPFFLKQVGANPVQDRGIILAAGERLDDWIPLHSATTGHALRSEKGNDPTEWPEDLRAARRLAWEVRC